MVWGPWFHMTETPGLGIRHNTHVGNLKARLLNPAHASYGARMVFLRSLHGLLSSFAPLLGPWAYSTGTILLQSTYYTKA